MVGCHSWGMCPYPYVFDFNFEISLNTNHEVTCHEHILKRERCPYQANYTCDLCHKHGHELSWCFRCDECGFDAHFECASIYAITKTTLITTSASRPTATQGDHESAPEAATPPSLPVTAGRYASQSQQLVGMGFTDEAENVLVLESTNGNIDQAIELLLQ